MLQRNFLTLAKIVELDSGRVMSAFFLINRQHCMSEKRSMPRFGSAECQTVDDYCVVCNAFSWGITYQLTTCVCNEKQAQIKLPPSKRFAVLRF